MFARLVNLLAISSLVACVAGPDAEPDPELDGGKADGGFAPVLKGVLPLSAPADVTLNDASGAPAEMVYFEFELSGPATVELAASDVPLTVYFYHPHDGSWGHSIARGGASLSHKFEAAGTYRALLKRSDVAGTPHTTVTASCTGDGCAPPQTGCTPLTARAAAPELFVGPTDWKASIEAAIDSAAGTLDVQMYLFTIPDIAQHIIAAHDRGVAVRVLLDPHADNSAVIKLLTDAGVPNKLDPTVFKFSHAKYMVIDGTTAVVLSGNFNMAAIDTTTAKGERNYGFVDHDADDAARIASIFEADWTSTSGAEPDLSCTRLVISPVNSKQRILDHIASATQTLDIEVLYLDDVYVRAAVVDRASHGVAVRVMLSDPTRNPQNTATLQYFADNHVPAKLLLTNYLHTKMLQADGVALVGSENMSETSLTLNRELGGLIFEPEPAAKVHAQYEADWANAQ
jgi:cardiolipin synthase